MEEVRKKYPDGRMDVLTAARRRCEIIVSNDEMPYLREPPQYFDGEDTLWENNIYFERAFEDLCDFLARASMAPAEVRAVLDEIETVTNKVHGYGTANFGRNLTECYHKLVEREIREQDIPRVMSFTEQIVQHPIELIAGVPETLEYLSMRHDLTLFTKGNPEEQKLKL